MENTYIKSLLNPVAAAPATKRVNGISLEVLQNAAVVWNVRGYTRIAPAAIGKPTAIATDSKTGEIKFKKDGTPSSVVVKEFKELGKTIMANVVAGIVADTQQGFSELKTECEAMIKLAQEAAKPLIEAENKHLTETLVARAAAIEAAEAKIREMAEKSELNKMIIEEGIAKQAAAEAETARTENENKSKGRKKELVAA
jgi:hypothetical protein